MNLSQWKIYDKAGDYINWTPASNIKLSFNSATGIGAEGYLVTDPSGFAIYAKITDGGYLYDDVITAYYTYAFSTGGEILLTPTDASILTTDVSIFSPDGMNTKSISGLALDLDASFSYPSVTYAAAIFLKPISVGLVETETLYIFQEIATDTYIRPYDASNSTILFRFEGDDVEIQFFTVDEDTTEITWTRQLQFDLSLYTLDTPITLNIGFRAETEGVFERILRAYHKVGDEYFILADILVNAESVGEDERFRTLITNFGLPDPKDIPQIFKETDINEDLPDWDVLNYKSKHLILEYDQIMPYIGTYKALINAIKWLGYDDIYVREWFKNVKDNTKLSVIVSYDAKDRTQTMLRFDANQRKTLKKLNQLSLVYCLTRETGEIDDWGTPLTENCYSYNIKEVFIKLMALKQWLERNIIGINCRIVDLTGEGVYFERIQNLIYTTDNIGFEYNVSQTLTPYGPDHDSELVTGDASVRLTFLELTNTAVQDLKYRFIDMAETAWNPNDPNIYYSLDDPSYLADPSSFLIMGATFDYPFVNIADIMYKLSVQKELGGVIGETLVTNPLFVYENEIRFYNTYDTSSIFYDVSTDLTILLEKAYLRDPSIDEWVNSIAYTIYHEPSNYYDYVLETSAGFKTYTSGYVTFTPDTSAKLQYAVDSNYKVPLLTFQYFSYTDASGYNQNFGDKEYILDIVDGKIYMNSGITDSSDNLEMYINFNYDTSLIEQQITVNAVYQSPRMRLFQVDPSIYYWADPSGLSGGNDPSIYIIDNSIYTFNIHHIGDYNIDMYAWDSYNTMMYNPAREPYPVWVKYPTIYFLVDNSSYMGYDVSKYMSYWEVSTLISNHPFPIYDRDIPLQGLQFLIDASGNPYIEVPSITYFQDVPEPNSYNRFFNLTERVVSISGTSLVIDDDFQKFYTGDNIAIVKFDKGKYALISEVSSNILTSSYLPTSNPTLITVDNIPADFIIDPSTDIYILNDTYRYVTNSSNNNNNFITDVSGYIFQVNQAVGVIVSDGITGYSWGSTYRVIDVSGVTHRFKDTIPDFFLDDPSRYTITVKHAFSTYSEFTAPTYFASESDNKFSVYLKTSYCQEYYVDNTFVYMNNIFDHDHINFQWYDPSLDLVNSEFYYYKKPIWVDTGTLVILRAEYDPSNYMLDQKNIWTARFNDNDAVYFKVYNESVPILFGFTTHFKINVESYDKYGNISKTE